MIPGLKVNRGFSGSRINVIENARTVGCGLHTAWFNPQTDKNHTELKRIPDESKFSSFPKNDHTEWSDLPPKVRVTLVSLYVI